MKKLIYIMILCIIGLHGLTADAWADESYWDANSMYFNPQNKKAECERNCKGSCVWLSPSNEYRCEQNNEDNSNKQNTENKSNNTIPQGTTKAECEKSCKGTCVWLSPSNEYRCEPKDENKVESAGTSSGQSESAVTGCSSDYGLFSGLIKSGRQIFEGLRDLIYVVAGFGIIGVAVGGFFGNLNWKWLGAILIALVVIASTGEVINMITGCQTFTQAMITDTLTKG